MGCGRGAASARGAAAPKSPVRVMTHAMAAIRWKWVVTRLAIPYLE
jgi:hypothetical protein